MDLKDLLQLAGLTNNAHAHSDDSLAHNGADEMRKLVVMIDPEQLNTMEPSGGCGCGSEDCGCGHDHDHMEEETVEEWANSGDHVSGEPEQMTNGHGELGSAVDTSLRRYLDASGANVKVDEEVYPDHTLEDISEAYAAFKEGKSRNYKDSDAYDAATYRSDKKVSLKKAPWEDDEDKKDKKEAKQIDELDNKTLTRYAMSADNDVQKRRSNRPPGEGDESDPMIGKRLDRIKLAHKKGAFKEQPSEIQKLLMQYNDDMEENRLYGMPDYDAVEKLALGGDFEEAADLFVSAYADQDGGEGNVEGVYQDLIDDLATMSESTDRKEVTLEQQPSEIQKLLMQYNDRMEENRLYGDPDFDAIEQYALAGDYEQAADLFVSAYADQDGGEDVSFADGIYDDLIDEFESMKEFLESSDRASMYQQKRMDRRIDNKMNADNLPHSKPMQAKKAATNARIDMLKQFAGIKEASKPDFLDIDGDGDKEESMKKAAKDKKAAEVGESIDILRALAGL